MRSINGELTATDTCPYGHSRSEYGYYYDAPNGKTYLRCKACEEIKNKIRKAETKKTFVVPSKPKSPEHIAKIQAYWENYFLMGRREGKERT